MIRVVSDDVLRRLPPAALCVGLDGRLRRWRFVNCLVRDPRQVLELLALRSDFHVARRTLGEVWRLAGPGLELPVGAAGGKG